MTPNILIVDDMPDAIDFLPKWLQREGYTTMMATRGPQALALAEEKRPDVILLDVMMPGMDGIETCRRLRLNPATADIPVILLSARSPSEARAEGLVAGATDYITKPIHFPDLLERITRAMHLDLEAAPDHQRLLQEMAYTTLTVLPCNLAWLLIVDRDNRWLVSEAIAVDRGADAAQQFLSMLQGHDDDVRFPLVQGNNPLAELVLNKRVLINVPAAQFHDLTGGGTLAYAFAQFQFAFVSLVPLVTARRVVGVMVLATMEAHIAQSRRAQQILNSLGTQAAMAVDNARLVAGLAAREQQMHAEQAFRQTVLDTMGEGLIVVDDEARITYVNNRLLRLTGHTREQLYGQSVSMVFHPSCRERLVGSLTGQRRGTMPFAQRVIAHDGKEIPVLLSQATALMPGERGRSTVMVVTDLSDLQRNEDALRVQTQRLRAINRASMAVSSVRSFQDVIEISLESARQVVQGVSASILLRDADDLNRLYRVALAGPHLDGAETKEVTIGDGLTGWVAGAPRPQLVTDMARSEDIRAQYADIYGPDLRSLVAVPLIAFDEVIGVLEVVNKTGGVFDEQDLESLESLAGAVAITVENARLFEQMRRRVTELSTLMDASAAVSSTLNLDAILEQIARQLILALRVERVVIANWDRPSNRLDPLAEVVNACWRPGEGPLCPVERLPLTCSVLESGTLMLAQDVRVDEADPAVVELTPSGLHTAAGFPIKVAGQLVGAITLHSELSGNGLTSAQAGAVSDVIAGWAGRVEEWLTRPALTDLCQQVLQASDSRWCTVIHWDRARDEIRLVREIGRALWLGRSGLVWNVAQYPSLATVLEQRTPLTLQRDTLEHDPHEQAYLRAVGGLSCLVAPLLVRGEATGLVKLVDTGPEKRVFDGAEISLCQGIANVVSNAMENAQLYGIQQQRASALEAAYKDLQEADRAKEDLLQNLSHELRTPLTHILGYLRLIKDEAFGPLSADQHEAMELVLDKSQQLADLVKDILAVQEADSADIQPRPIHLDRVITLAVRAVTAQARMQDVTIMSQLPPDLPQAYADPLRVGEAVEELLENAIKFSPRGSQVEVSVIDQGGPMLRISVQDHGIGIAPVEHEKIFRQFYQVDSGTTRRYGGAGLGLAVVRRVIEGHNGRVWVESQAGQGSCFYVTLPKAGAMIEGN